MTAPAEVRPQGVPWPAEYLGNIFIELEKALDGGAKQYLLDQSQMRQVVEIHAAVIEAKNVTVRENWALTEQLKAVRNDQERVRSD